MSAQLSVLIEGLWKAALVGAVCSWFWGAYHTVKSWTYIGIPESESEAAAAHRRNARRGVVLFVGLLVFAFVVGFASHQFLPPTQ